MRTFFHVLARRYVLLCGVPCLALVLAACGSANSGIVATPSALTPSAISYTGSAALNGKQLSVTLTITNSGTSSVTTSFPVDFYLATSTSFSPTSDPSAGSVTVSQTIAGGSSVSVSPTLTLPTLPSGDFGTSEGIATYLYAVVDPNNLTGASSSPSNTSTAANAAPLTLFYPTNVPSGGYTIAIQTYPPASPPSTVGGITGTGTTNPGVALYKDSSGSLTLVAFSWQGGGVDYFNSATANSLTAGTTYYVAIQSVGGGSGAYALDLLPSPTSITMPAFTALTSAPAVSNHTPTLTVTSGTPDSPITSVPSGAVELKVGTAVNWYLSSGTDTDWFTFTLP